MRRGRLTAVLALGAVLYALGGCGSASSGGDYPSYGSIEELFGAADLVVLGRVDSVETRQIDIGGGATFEYEVYRLEIDKAYKGAPASATVEVKRHPGEGAGLTVDGRYVLFLEDYPDVPASLLNPTQAQYAVDGAGITLSDNPIEASFADLERLSLAS